MIIYVDIDGTITETDGSDYESARPVYANIEKINKLFDMGNKIVYWTARGSVTGIDWSLLTKKQLEIWGAKYHELKMRKPNYDLFICDKSVNLNTYQP